MVIKLVRGKYIHLTSKAYFKIEISKIEISKNLVISMI